MDGFIKRVYIAGPYTHPDPAINTRNAVLAAEEVVSIGLLPFVPHLTHLWHLISPHDIEFWYEYDLKWLQVCQVLWRLPGESKGADAEAEYAIQLGIPIVHSLGQLQMWGTKPI